MNPTRIVLCESFPPRISRTESDSTLALKVHRALRLCGLCYERRHGTGARAFRDWNPARDAPVLFLEGTAIVDSALAVSAIDAATNHRLSRHLDAEERARAFLLEEMADNLLGDFVAAARWIDDDNWPKTKAAQFSGLSAVARSVVSHRVRRRVRDSLWSRGVLRPDLDACWSRLSRSLERLESAAPPSGFWFGSSPSRADVALFAPLWSLRTAVTERQGALVAAHPRLCAWLERVDAACARATVTPCPSRPLSSRQSAAGADVAAWG